MASTINNLGVSDSSSPLEDALFNHLCKHYCGGDMEDVSLPTIEDLDRVMEEESIKKQTEKKDASEI